MKSGTGGNPTVRMGVNTLFVQLFSSSRLPTTRGWYGAAAVQMVFCIESKLDAIVGDHHVADGGGGGTFIDVVSYSGYGMLKGSGKKLHKF